MIDISSICKEYQVDIKIWWHPMGLNVILEKDGLRKERFFSHERLRHVPVPEIIEDEIKRTCEEVINHQV